MPCKIRGINAHDETGRRVVVAFHTDLKIAAVHKVKAVNIAVFLRCAGLGKRRKGVVAVGGRPPLAVDPL